MKNAMDKTKYMSAHLSLELEKMNIGGDEDGGLVSGFNSDDALKAFKGKELEAELRELLIHVLMHVVGFTNSNKYVSC